MRKMERGGRGGRGQSEEEEEGVKKEKAKVNEKERTY